MWAARTSSSLVTLVLTCIAAILALTLLVCVPVDSAPVSPQHRGHHGIAPRAELDTPPPSEAPMSSLSLSSTPTTASIITGPSQIPTTTKKKDHQTPKETEKQENKYNFEILNPSPQSVWTSGSLETITWIHSNLPAKATFDIYFIPVDPETNPEAIEITRRPILRYINARQRYLDVVVPYDLITKEQLTKEQEGDDALIGGSGENGQGDIAPMTGSDNTTTTPTTDASTPSLSQDIRSLARLYITAYEGRTNKVLVRKSVFPVEILKDHAMDKRTVSPPPPILGPVQQQDRERQQNQDQQDQDQQEDKLLESMEDLLEKKDQGIIHLGEHMHEVAAGGDKKNGDGNSVFDPTNSTPGGDPSSSNETDEKSELGETVPTMLEAGEDLGSMDHQHHPGHETMSEGEEEDDGEGMHHDHTVNPDHLPNDEDLKLWEEIIDRPGYNPPIKVIDAGMIQITRWIDNKVRFFVGAPYVFAWEFPASGAGLTGDVSVYVEDAFTGKRYDMAAGPLSSSIQFMYLRPSAIMMSANPKKRIYLRARVELDLFKVGNIHRYTGFSKVFWVERGAL
ncbi:hypothetical protein BGZ65_012379 [Modicella reniformis]|uniref:Uncharacterized protein n=1 Tax=Modicella reniformis TaxID=1440133 RepID=A0A9P6MLM0_9FUNG|nr:hypothetical protein BGZ65_012379 [Modicella reniformis]